MCVFVSEACLLTDAKCSLCKHTVHACTHTGTYRHPRTYICKLYVIISDEKHAQIRDQIFSHQSVFKHLFEMLQKVLQDAVDAWKLLY